MAFDVNYAVKKMEEFFKGSKVNAVYDMGKAYLFSMKPNGDKEALTMDPFFKVEKSTGDIYEYSPVMNPEEFKKALNNLVYPNKS